MNILFAGTPQEAVGVLTAVHTNFKVVGVLTAPDKPQGRSGRTVPPPVKVCAASLNLPCLQPQTLDDAVLGRVSALKPALLVVAAFGMIFRQNFLSLFKQGAVNLHPSLLPRYRGPSPVQAAILHGDSLTGVTLQRLALKMDRGDILAQQEIALNQTETAALLLEKSFRLGAEMLIEVLHGIEAGHARSVKQDESQASYCRLLKKEDGRLSWRESADEIERMTRAYVPWPGVFCLYRGQKLELIRVELVTQTAGYEEANIPPGRILGMDKNHGILVKTCRGIFGLTQLKLANKRAMDFKSFYNGHRDLVGTQLE